KNTGKQIETLYIGGGTPTTLSAQEMDKLINALFMELDLSKILEFTVEAGRPDTITKEKLEVLKKHNVTRISINPQTMNDDTLVIKYDFKSSRNTIFQETSWSTNELDPYSNEISKIKIKYIDTGLNN
ncbi:radical SAM protein, partial [Clostridium sp.]|uniref:radical SAM protein n=1 Tax=Clostridium sp. TaxID=1506 RepID=UPI0034531CA7